MAEHSLRIQAHLDVNELNQELDRLNQQSGGEGNDTTGNSISLGMRLRQLQLSLDNLNKTLQGMVRSSNSASTQPTGVVPTDMSRLAPFLPGKGNRTSIQTLPQRAALARAMIANGWNAGFNGDLYWRKGGAFREAMMDLPENQSLAAQYRGLQAQSRQDKAMYDVNELRERARGVRRGLAVGGHFAGLIGQSLQEAGYQKAGGAFNILGGTMGAASSGAMMGGLWGAAIGGMIGMITTTTSELSKMAKAAEEAANKMNALGRSEQDQWFEFQNDQRLTGLQKAIENSELVPGALDFYGAQVEKFQNQAKMEMDNTKSLYVNFHKMAEDAYGNPNLSDENRKELLDKSLAAYKEYQTAASRYGQWEELGKQVQKIRDFQDPYSNENHLKWLEAQLALEAQAAETRAKNEETRKQLLQEREQILLGIEQEYAQQGVDILSGMGKSGKYMSQAEAASTSQERYAPITKKLDNMQKSLDHLSQIDAKLRNLNIGLT